MQTTKLSASSRNLLLTVHIATTVGVLGADLVLLALGIRGLRGGDPATIYPAAHLVGSWLVTPLALLALGTGLLLALLTPFGVFRYWWVAIKLAITAALTAAVVFVLVPRLGAAAEAAIASASDTLAITERIPLAVAPAVASALLLVALVLAVFKPSWRIGSGSKSSPAASRIR